MSKICALLVIAMLLVVGAGCKSTERGDREFIPGKGWKPVQ